jgi:tRNA(Ile)-lysidine synthase
MHASTSHIPASVAAKLREKGLCLRGTRLLIAVSGGADSMALLHLVSQLATEHALHLHIVHMNHGIRQDASIDQDLVAATCREYGWPCTTTFIDVPAASRASGASIEMEARQQRYAFFKTIYTSERAHALLTGHNRNDQSETILLNLARGCSPAALAGIAEDTTRSGMRIVRPLLSCNKDDIINYLQSRGLAWRVDTTNTDLAYKRNAIRHAMLPLMRQHLNPQLDDAFQRCATLAKADEELLQTLAHDAAPGVIPADEPDSLRLSVYRELPEPIRRRILLQWLWRQDLISSHSLHYDLIRQTDLLAMQSAGGRQIPLPAGKHIQHAYDRLVILGTAPDKLTCREISPHILPLSGCITIPSPGCKVQTSQQFGFKKEPTTRPGTLPACCFIRPPANNEVLLIRTRKDGDRIQMTGTSGHQKLQDILTDYKIPSYERDRIPLLATQKGLVWIPGLRISKEWTVAGSDAPSLKIRITPLTEDPAATARA